MSINLGNVVGLLRSTIAPTKKYVLWAKILNPVFPDIVEVNYWDEINLAWTPITDSTNQHWLRPVISIETAPPGAPVEGDRHLIASVGATGAFSGKEDQVATYRSGAWQYQIPLDGYIVSNRSEINKLYDYRGTYGAGGTWFENDFQVPIAPGTYIAAIEKAAANGVATLDVGIKIPAAQINGSTLPFVPINAGAWTGGTATIWSALEQLRLVSPAGLYGADIDSSVDPIVLDSALNRDVILTADTDIAANKVLQFLNHGNMLRQVFTFTITAVCTLELPAACMMPLWQGGWNDTTKILDFNDLGLGDFQLTFIKRGVNYQTTLTGPF